MTREEYCDSLWTEIRQLVLDEGPVVESVDRMIADCPEFPEDEREGLVAQIIALRCANIVAAFKNRPVVEVLGNWAAQEMAHSISFIILDGMGDDD